MLGRIKRALVGSPRDLRDPHTYHALSLVAFLAWVGLGADGLSSSAYGPEETFNSLGQEGTKLAEQLVGPGAPPIDFTFLVPFLALATALTVAVIATAYSRIIEAFPFGGGGYVVATKLLGPRVGVVSGAALVVDYILTISVSIASGCAQVFSVFPPDWGQWKLVAAACVLVTFVVLNLRGVKESVTILTPIFGVFLLTHAILVVGGIGSHAGEVPAVAAQVRDGWSQALPLLGVAGIFRVFLHAYSMGGGTYTGIEAVSNGLQIMREPKVQTAKRTMLYMAISLALCAGGILVCYLLFHVRPVEGKTLNAVLLHNFAGDSALGQTFVVVTLASAAALLFVAAQAGFIDGPRVMANMAHDGWVPRRFAELSDRLAMQNGVVVMAVAALATLLVTRGSVSELVVMYSINVFLTFSISQVAMLRYWKGRHGDTGRRRGILLHGFAFILCTGILVATVHEKFAEGGWLTVVATASVVAVCFWIKSRYRRVQTNLGRLDSILELVPKRDGAATPKLDHAAPTAVLLVGAFSGLGIHALFSIRKTFGDHFKNVVFVGVGVVDSASMTGIEEVDRIRDRVETAMKKYVDLAERIGFAASYRTAIGVEVVPEAVTMCKEIARTHPRSVVFAGKLVFQKERWYQRILHNETAHSLQRALQFENISCMVLPVRVTEPGAEPTAAK